MNTAEVDIDRLVNYEKEYRNVIKKAIVSDGHLTGLCPFHDDKNNSFSVDLATGKWHCFAEDEGGNVIKATPWRNTHLKSGFRKSGCRKNAS